MPEQRAETEPEAARRAGRGTLSHIDDDASANAVPLDASGRTALLGGIFVRPARVLASWIRAAAGGSLFSGGALPPRVLRRAHRVLVDVANVPRPALRAASRSVSARCSGISHTSSAVPPRRCSAHAVRVDRTDKAARRTVGTSRD